MEIIKNIPNDLLELQESVEEHIEEFISGKLEKANIPERAYADIEDKAFDLKMELSTKFEEFEAEIDDIIEEFSYGNLRAVKNDMKRQDEKEVDLWN